MKMVQQLNKTRFFRKLQYLLVMFALIGLFIFHHSAEAAAEFTVLHRNTTDVGFNSTGFFEDKNNPGIFYGSFVQGGKFGRGTIFRLDTKGVTPIYTVLFDGGGVNNGIDIPATIRLIQGNDGNLYGISTLVGSIPVTFFQIDISGATPVYKVLSSGLHTPSTVVQLTDLFQGNDGKFYGASIGSIVQIDISGSTPTVTVLHDFEPIVVEPVVEPSYYMIQGRDNKFYGTTSTEGRVGLGTIFQLDISGGTPIYTVLHEFDNTGSSAFFYLFFSLAQGLDGKLYGTNLDASLGSIFQLDISGLTPVYTVLHSFNDTDNNGFFPTGGGQIVGRNGKLYGTTTEGGPFAAGTVYELDLSGLTPIYTVLHGFDEFEGAQPQKPLFQGSDGNLYGISDGDGAGSNGIIYKVTLPTDNATITALTSSPNPSASGQTVTFTATVSGTSPSGTVNFIEGATTLGTSILDGSGVATFSTSALSAGNHSITASYTGDIDDTPSTSAALVQAVITGDTTPPLISEVFSPSVPTSGWFNTDVRLSWDVIDLESAIISELFCTDAANPILVNTDTAGTNHTCTATSSGGTSSKTVTVKRDTVPPILGLPSDIVQVATSNAGANLTFQTTVADALSSVNDQGITCSHNSGDVFPIGDTTVTCSATDIAGNTANGSFKVTVTPIVVNNTPPVAVNDTFAIAPMKRKPLTIASPGVLINDTDADGDAFTVLGATDTTPIVLTLTNGTGIPSGDKVELYADGHFVYTPTAYGKKGKRSFTYQVTDGKANSSTAKVTLTIHSHDEDDDEKPECKDKHKHAQKHHSECSSEHSEKRHSKGAAKKYPRDNEEY
jgi:uncharacterized repeat protein (TIGR03803 family)